MKKIAFCCVMFATCIVSGQGPMAVPAQPAERIVSADWIGEYRTMGGNDYQFLEVSIKIKGLANTPYWIGAYYQADGSGENAGPLAIGGMVMTDANGDWSGKINDNTSFGLLTFCQNNWAGNVEMWADEDWLVSSTGFVNVSLVDKR